MRTIPCISLLAIALLNIASLAFAQTDLNGSSITIDNAGPWNTAYTNSSDTQSVITFDLSGGTQRNYSGALTENIKLVVQFNTNESNGNRLTLSGTNTFTGGVYVNSGTLRVDNTASLPSDTIYFNGGSLMSTSADVFAKTINIVSDRAALRGSSNTGLTVAGKITGNGALDIVNDAEMTLTNTANDYTDYTYIGNRGYRNDALSKDAKLTLGASGVIPDSSVVQMGGGSVTGNIIFNIGSYTETIAGLIGNSKSTVNGTSGTLNMTTASGETYSYQGTLAGADATNLLTFNVLGAGTESLSNATFSNIALSVGDTATLITPNTVSASSISVGSTATLQAATSTDAMNISLTGTGTSTFSGAITAGSIAITQTGAGTIVMGDTVYSSMTVDLQAGTFKLSPTNGLAGAAVTFASDSTLDLNGSAVTYDVLPNCLISNTGTQAGTINIGNSTSIDGTFTGQFIGGSKGINVVKSGENTQIIGGNLNASVTDLAINGGTVELNRTGNNTVFSNVVINDTGTLKVTTGNTAIPRILGTVTINTGGTLDLNKGSLELNSLTLSNGSTVFDLNGGNLVSTNLVTASFPAITNSDSNNLSTITSTEGSGTQKTFSNVISGNIRLVLDRANNDNNTRLRLWSANNTFTGGIQINKGILQFSAESALGAEGTRQVDLNGGVLMCNANLSSTVINLMSNGGTIRAAGGSKTISSKITGAGDLTIAADNLFTLSNPNNDYSGKTTINSTGLTIAASGALSPNTVVELNANSKLTLNSGTVNTAAGLISSQSTSNIAGPGTLKIVDAATSNTTYAGKISTAFEKAGSGTLTLTGDNSSAGSITVSGGTLVASGTNSIKTAVNLTGGTLAYTSNVILNNATSISAVSGNSTIVVPVSGSYNRELFAEYHYSGNFTEAATYITDMDALVNHWYPSDGDRFTVEQWGVDTDSSYTNVLQTSIANITDSPISVDFSSQFRNDVLVTITDSQGNSTTVIDWVNSTGNADRSVKTGTFVFQPGEEYSIDLRLYRYNRSIGATKDSFHAADYGLAAKVTGTSSYSKLNISDNGLWTFTDGSFRVLDSAGTGTFSTNVDVAEGATLTMKNASSGTVTYTNNFTGTGTVAFGAETETGRSIFSGVASGDVVVLDGIAFSGNNGTIAGSLTLNSGSIYSITDDMGEISIGTIDGSGRIEVDMDSLDWTNGYSGVWINVADIANSDFTNLALDLSTDNPNDYRERVIEVFAGTDLTAEILNGMLTSNIWRVVDLGNGQFGFTVNTNTIPEPSTWLLLILGCLGLVAVKKWTKR